MSFGFSLLLAVVSSACVSVDQSGLLVEASKVSKPNWFSKVVDRVYISGSKVYYQYRRLSHGGIQETLQMVGDESLKAAERAWRRCLTSSKGKVPSAKIADVYYEARQDTVGSPVYEIRLQLVYGVSEPLARRRLSQGKACLVSYD